MKSRKIFKKKYTKRRYHCGIVLFGPVGIENRKQSYEDGDERFVADLTPHCAAPVVKWNSLIVEILKLSGKIKQCGAHVYVY